MILVGAPSWGHQINAISLDAKSGPASPDSASSPVPAAGTSVLSPKRARRGVESRRWRYVAGGARTTTLSGVVSEAVTPQMALITASATLHLTAALRQALGSQVILRVRACQEEHGC